MTVGIVTDSAASLPADLAAAKGITVVPLHLNLGDESLLDGDIALEQVIDRLDEGLKTSGPAPGEFAAAIAAADSGDGVVVLTIAADMSSTHDAARLATQLADDTSVEVVDTGTA
ncbi:MAG TPA: DegV family protein, partial [Acidimicrobiales bacterium]|nr:DegV family protein [Acidimicrobiales bacterium]